MGLIAGGFAAASIPTFAGLVAPFSMLLVMARAGTTADTSVGNVDSLLAAGLAIVLAVALPVAAGLAVRTGRFWGLLASLGSGLAWTFGINLALALLVAVALAVTGQDAAVVVSVPILLLIPLVYLASATVGIVTLALTVAVVVVVAGALAVPVTAVATLGVATVSGVAIASVTLIVRALVDANPGVEALATVLPGVLVGGAVGALSLIPFGWYLRRRTLAEDPQFAGLRRWVLAYAAWPGTDFRDAILTGADFSGARMTYARVGRPADLTRVRFRGARDLRLAHVPGTILADRRVRELLVSGEGAHDFDHADLHGAWLRGANLRGARLCDVELTGADLSGADLSDADLSRANLIGADLRGAILTGALLEGWNIDTATRLDGAAADYVYLESGPKGERRERRPQGEGTFGPGDFATLFKRAFKTVDLIFRNGIDWGAFRAAFDDLHAYYADFGDGREREVRVQSIENTDDGRLIIRIAVPDRADKDADYRRLTAAYEQHIAALEAAYQRDLLDSERRHNAELVRMIDAVRAQPLTIHNIVQNARETDQMAGGDSIHQSGNFSGSNINVKSSLTQVSQAIGTLPGLDEAGRRQLSELLAELANALAQTPPERAQEAAAVAALTAELIEKARAAPPNPPLLRISAEGVLKAAKSLAETAAPVLKILEQVVGLLGVH